MDNFFGWDFTDNLVKFHGQLCPHKQVQLLLLWGFISCPFEDQKQEHGEQLKIIGFWVDAQARSISLSPHSITDMVDKINAFLNTPDRSPALRDWQ
jgi:hypothetical protein